MPLVVAISEKRSDNTEKRIKAPNCKLYVISLDIGKGVLYAPGLL